MEKRKVYTGCRFHPDTVIEAMNALRGLATDDAKDVTIYRALVYHDDATWNYDDFGEFIADYRSFSNGAELSASVDKVELWIYCGYDGKKIFTSITIKSDSRSNIYNLFEIFERGKEKAVIVFPDQSDQHEHVKIFIGHGRSVGWRDLKDHLQDKHGYQVVAYETGARAGHAIRDILEEMMAEASFAILVMTGEDTQADGAIRSRQNVIHEAGLFQGKLGFPRAIILLEEGVEAFSNVDGIQYIGFAKGKIKETFGDVLAVLKREFDS